MIKKIFFIAFCTLSFTMANANSTDNYDKTFVTITNNTSRDVNVDIELSTTDKHYNDGKDWHEQPVALAPYMSKQVLWFKRDHGINSHEKHQFKISIRHPDYISQPILLDLLEQAKPAYNSTVTTSIILPEQAQATILTRDELQTLSGNYWGNSTTVYARRWSTSNKAFDDYQFVIDQPQINSFDTSANNKISVLTYNTQLLPIFANAVDDLNQPMLRAKAIPKKIKNYDAVIFEEAVDDTFRDILTNAMKSYYPYHTKVASRLPSRLLSGGIILFSKWPIIREDQIAYSKASKYDELVAKGVIYAAISKNGKVYHIMGTHTQAAANKPGESREIRALQLKEWAEFIERLRIPENEPLILAGDFNVNQFGTNTELNSILTMLNVKLLPNTGHPYSADPTINTMLHSKSPSRIDYLFYHEGHVKPTVAFNKVFILRYLEDQNAWPKFDLSDHFPVVGYFEFGE
ncbi:MAG: hypothetical protein A3F14_00655 [Gammaproteobacteria bacterium RIFCSPHIGHO2_12_FULL_43_28]|nr:MAG: hypothetical protein A3F14_00655 [Gammaproteobacteria bacterium RIFCSPHIGHO2_12_FULL_43_28]